VNKEVIKLKLIEIMYFNRWNRNEPLGLQVSNSAVAMALARGGIRTDAIRLTLTLFAGHSSPTAVVADTFGWYFMIPNC